MCGLYPACFFPKRSRTAFKIKMHYLYLLSCMTRSATTAQILSISMCGGLCGRRIRSRTSHYWQLQFPAQRKARRPHGMSPGFAARCAIFIGICCQIIHFESSKNVCVWACAVFVCVCECVCVSILFRILGTSFSIACRVPQGLLWNVFDYSPLQIRAVPHTLSILSACVCFVCNVWGRF